MNAAVLAWAIAMATLTAAAIYLWHENRRNPGPPSRLHQVLASHDQAEKDRLDSMIDVVSDRRDEGNQNLAWPPEAEWPVGLVPVPRAPVVTRLRCGCIYRDGLLWLPCSPLAVLQDHIDKYADGWAAGLAEEDM